MKASVYKLTHGVYLADLAGRQIKRGSILDLARALNEAGISVDNLLLGDWREGAELFNSSEQEELRTAMMTRQERAVPVPGLDSSAAANPAV